MICRLFPGFIRRVDGNLIIDRINTMVMGQNQVFYVLDELSLGAHNKYDSNISDPNKILNAQFRLDSPVGPVEYLEKYVRPVTIQEPAGMRSVFNFSDDEKLLEFVENWRVDVKVPDRATSIPEGATGVLIPRPYIGIHPPDYVTSRTTTRRIK